LLGTKLYTVSHFILANPAWIKWELHTFSNRTLSPIFANTLNDLIHTVILIDSHCHLDVEEFDPDRDQVLASARKAGVVGIVVPGVDARRWRHLLDYCAGKPDLHPALGLHPVYIDDHQDEHLQLLEKLLTEVQPIAVGEIGLDYFVDHLDRHRQQYFFEAQLVLARAGGLPAIVHVRKAHDQVIQTLRRHPVTGGIIHAFNGSLQQAKQYIDLGFKLGFGGMLTYARSHKLRALAKELPLEAIVLETDAPDMTVAQYHGHRNSPEYLPYCLAALAEIREIDPALVAVQTTDNTCQVLGLTNGICSVP
jgi:TatD DNase family protein